MSDLQRANPDSRHLSAERRVHREWIGGRIATLLAHYWREDDPDELLGAMGRDWADVLEGMPQDAIQRACIWYLRDEPRRRPTPGAILTLARAEMPKPRIVETRQQAPVDPPPRVTPEQARAIMEAAGFAPKRFGGASDE